MFLIRDKLSPRRNPCKISVSILLFLLKATFSFVRDETIIFSLGEAIIPFSFLSKINYFFSYLIEFINHLHDCSVIGRDAKGIFSLGESIIPGLKSYTFLLILSYYYRLSFYLQLNLRNWGVPGERFARSPTRLPRPLSATPSGRPPSRGIMCLPTANLLVWRGPCFSIILSKLFKIPSLLKIAISSDLCFTFENLFTVDIVFLFVKSCQCNFLNGVLGF